MSQHDFDIANQGFPATRADINNALQAAVSNSAGTSAPSTTYAYQFWYDSTNNIIKLRNSDNDAWIDVATVDQTNDLISITHTGMLDLVDDDGSASIRFQAPSTVTSTTTFTLPDGDGDSGQTLITNGSGTLAWAAPYGNRNLIINGSMAISQRGTDINTLTNGSICADRFKTVIANVDDLAMDYDQSTDVPSGSGFANSLKLSVASAEGAIAADEYVSFGQRIEAQNLQHLKYGTSSGEKITLSFWVKSSVTGTYAISIFQQDASSSPDRRYHSKTYTISSANTWEYKTITIDPNTDDAIANDTGIGLRVDWVLSAGSNYTSGSNNTWGAITNWMVGHNASWITTSSATFFLTGVQLEVGETATPFEHRSYGDELRRCQRYFQTLRGQDRYPGDVGQATVVFGSTNLLQTPMRAQPSLSVSGALSFDEYYVANRTQSSANIVRNSGNTQCVVPSFANFSSMTVGNSGSIYNANIDIDAEL